MKLIRTVLLPIIFAAFVMPCFAQSGKPSAEQPPPPATEYNASAWKEFKSAEGRFTVLFPGVPREETQTVSVPGGQLEIRIYSLNTSFPYSVVYSDYPAAPPDSESANRLLGHIVKGAVAEVNAQLLSEEKIIIDGHPGRLLKERLPDGKILKAKFYLVGPRLYQIAITMPSEESAPDGGHFYRTTASKFLDSFKLLSTEAATSPQESGFGFIATRKGDALVRGRCEPPQCRPAEGELKVGSLVSKPVPEYPKIAQAARATGTVKVQITVDEEGKVIDAAAVSGHALLQASAVKAAYDARFAPTLLDGKPVKVTGVLNYDFILQ